MWSLWWCVRRRGRRSRAQRRPRARATPTAQDGQQLTVDTFEDVPIRVNLPEIVECEIAKIEGIQATGIRAGGSKAHARLTNGIVLECPAHVQPGDRVRVHVAERRYVSKA